MKNRKRFLLVRLITPTSIILLIVFGAYLIWKLFVIDNLLKEVTEQVAAILASFGLLFGVIQILINEIRRRREFFQQRRYEEYKYVRSLIQSFTNELNDNMTHDPDPYRLENRLLNINNELSAALNTSNSRLFPGIIDDAECKKVEGYINDILLRTSKFRKEFDDTKNKAKPNSDDIEIPLKIISMNWHNDIRDAFKKLHNTKYDLFKFCEKYI